ncbi:MAG: TetR/AcrR family transcriptional regulator [Rhodanobacteraceae bacterium]
MSSKKPARSPGRPANSRGDQRARLLDAAIAIFSRQSIAETSLRAVARRARVTPALVHYYFGNRELLVDALVVERILPLVAGLGARLAAVGPDPRELVRTFVTTIIGMLAENAWLPPIWVREVLAENGALREQLLTRIAPNIAPELARRLAEAQRLGLLNPGLDPKLTVVSLIGLTIFPLASQSIWRRLLGADDIDANAIVEHTLALLASGLGAAPASRIPR